LPAPALKRGAGRVGWIAQSDGIIASSENTLHTSSKSRRPAQAARILAGGMAQHIQK